MLMEVVEFVIFIALVAGYVYLGILALRFLAKKIGSYVPFLRLLIVSCLGAFIFGIGIAASGGDPGVALPVPVFLAALWTHPDAFVRSAVIPFGFWWLLFFLVLSGKHAWNIRSLRRSASGS
jgi:hypothetical protein